MFRTQYSGRAHMRTSHALALVLGLTGLGTACGDGNGPSNTPPAVAFTPTCVLLDCTFADGSTDADGQLTAYTWDFGDGTAAAITKDAVHTYGTANTYPVRLTVTDNDGATSDLTQSVLVHAPANVPPTAAFTSSCAGLACSFSGLGSDEDGAAVGFQWDFGDGAVATTQNATHTYASAGTYAVELTVTDDGGATGLLSQQVTATGPAAGEPTASFAGSCVITGSFVRLVFVDCTFTDQSTAAAGATVTAWAWEFGNGRTSIEQNPPVQHYTISWRPGMRVSARLTVTDNSGLTNSVTSSVPVTAPQTGAPTIALGISSLLQNLCYPARHYSTRGCPSGGSVTISNSGGGTLKWTSTTSAPWLKRSPTSGTAPSTMTVWVDGAALPPGSYSGDILISAEGATNSPRGVFVHVTR
jgi:PKD repeat protein